MKNPIQRFSRSLRRAMANHKYEMSPGGLLIAGMQIGGRFGHSVNDGPMLWDRNLVVNEGLDDILNVYLNNQAQTPTWYVAPFAGNVTPAASWTAANFTANSTEFTNYDEATRVEWNEAAASAQSITNLANKAAFTIGAGGGTIYGAALLSTATKSGTGGKLFAASKFSTSRAVVEDDVLNIAYTLSAASS